MKLVIRKLIELLYPKRCPFCRKLMDEKRPVCPLCHGKLPLTIGNEQSQSFPFVDNCVSPLYYEGTVRESLHRYKFSGAAAYAEIYGEFISKCIDENSISCDIITWVPLSAKRMRRRGYDQAELLARFLSARLGIECRKLLVKQRNNPAQSGTGNAEKRRKNVAGVYAVPEPEAVKGKHILLADDIVTTGSTVSECARMLKMAGAKSVTVITVARKRT